MRLGVSLSQGRFFGLILSQGIKIRLVVPILWFAKRVPERLVHGKRDVLLCGCVLGHNISNIRWIIQEGNILFAHIWNLWINGFGNR